MICPLHGKLQRAHEEGATFTLTNAPIAMRMGAINDLAKRQTPK